MQFTETNKDQVFNWVTGMKAADWVKDAPVLVIATLEGRMIANLGDYIIKGVRGEFYPCKPDIFEATYDTVVE